MEPASQLSGTKNRRNIENGRNEGRQLPLKSHLPQLKTPMPELQALVGDAERFMRFYWDAACGVFQVCSDEHWLHIIDLQTMLNDRVFRTPSDIRVMKDGRAVHPQEYSRPMRASNASVNLANESLVDADRVLELFDEGATVVFQGLIHHKRSIGERCSQLSKELFAKVNANAYLSAAASKGARHFDFHDVFMVQLQGTKRWQVNKPLIPHPTEQLAGQNDDVGEQLLDVVLKPGDVLYLPRGFWHECETGDNASLHLTISARALDCTDVLRSALEAFESEPAYRLSAFTATEISNAARTLATRACIDFRHHIELVIQEKLAISQSPAYVRRHASIVTRTNGHELVPECTLLAVASWAWQLKRSNTTLILFFNDCELELPLTCLTAIELLQQQGHVKVKMLASGHSDAVCLALARQLLRAGLVSIDGS